MSFRLQMKSFETFNPNRIGWSGVRNGKHLNVSKKTHTHTKHSTIMFPHLKLRLKSEMQCNAVECGNRSRRNHRGIEFPRFLF